MIRQDNFQLMKVIDVTSWFLFYVLSSSLNLDCQTWPAFINNHWQWPDCTHHLNTNAGGATEHKLLYVCSCNVRSLQNRCRLVFVPSQTSHSHSFSRSWIFFSTLWFLLLETPVCLSPTVCPPIISCVVGPSCLFLFSIHFHLYVEWMWRKLS